MNGIGRHRDAVRRFIHSRLAPQTDHAEDVTQEVFVAAWENLGAYRGNSSLESWLMGIARNKIKDYYRARLREPATLEKVEGHPAIARSQVKIDEELEKDWQREKAREVVRGLPWKYRCALIWRYWEGCSVKTMALRTGKTEKAVERMLARAREEFRLSWDEIYLS